MVSGYPRFGSGCVGICTRTDSNDRIRAFSQAVTQENSVRHNQSARFPD